MQGVVVLKPHGEQERDRLLEYLLSDNAYAFLANHRGTMPRLTLKRLKQAMIP